MNQFLVLVSRHFWDDHHTTQMREMVNTWTRADARDLVRAMLPQEYVHMRENGRYIGYVAHFTGEIYALR